MTRVTRIYFNPCTGFGSEGRSASLYAGDENIGHGYGATDQEAVIEALIDSGMEYDAAFDACYQTMRNARIDRNETGRERTE